MELAAAFAVPPASTYAPLPFSEAHSQGAAADVAGPTAAEDARAETAAAGNTTADTALDRAAEQVLEEREVVRRLTAEDFAAIQEQLGLRRREGSDEDAGIPGDIQPEELTEVAIVDDEAGLAIRETLEAELQPSLPLPDFSSVVADAVVTIDEYLDWVNEVGGQPR